MHRPKRHKTAILLRPSTCAPKGRAGADSAGVQEGHTLAYFFWAS